MMAEGFGPETVAMRVVALAEETNVAGGGDFLVYALWPEGVFQVAPTHRITFLAASPLADFVLTTFPKSLEWRHSADLSANPVTLTDREVSEFFCHKTLPARRMTL
jgi:hypothetical protein